MTRAIIQGRRTGVEVRKLRKDLRKKPLAAVAVNAEKTRVMSTSTDGSSPSRSACRGDRGNAHTRASILSAAPPRRREHFLMSSMPCVRWGGSSRFSKK
jgi:hypothetical protein